MSWLSGIPVIGNIIDGIAAYQKGKQAIKAAKQAGQIAVIERASKSQSDWSMLMAKGALSSWKDEFVLMLLAAPYIMSFIPGGAQYAHDGFTELDLMPDWYTYLLVTVFLASYGIRLKDSFMSKLTK